MISERCGKAHPCRGRLCIPCCIRGDRSRPSSHRIVIRPRDRFHAPLAQPAWLRVSARANTKSQRHAVVVRCLFDWSVTRRQDTRLSRNL
jgi:hypothetical protein